MGATTRLTFDAYPGSHRTVVMHVSKNEWLPRADGDCPPNATQRQSLFLSQCFGTPPDSRDTGRFAQTPATCLRLAICGATYGEFWPDGNEKHQRRPRVLVFHERIETVNGHYPASKTPPPRKP